MNSISRKVIILMLGCYLVTGCHLFSKATFKKPKFNPDFSYMRVVINNNKESWVVSNFNDNWPKPNSSVWYSKDLGIIRVNNGRLISYGTVHPAYNWIEKSDTEINWKKIISGQSQIIHRCVTNTIKNDTDFCDRNIIRRMSSQPTNLDYRGSKKLIWVRERSELNNEPWKEIWYGINSNNLQPVYGSLCLNKENCLSWQLWK